MKRVFVLLTVVSLVVTAASASCIYLRNTGPAQPIIFSGRVIFLKDVGHPFSGPGVLTEKSTYGLGAESTSILDEITQLKNGQPIYVEGLIYEQGVIVPEGGRFVSKKYNVLRVSTYKVLGEFMERSY